jgi:uncharacterized protein YbjQ (UPF0145 family)
MLLSTTAGLPGKKITQVLGLAQGNTIRARHLGRDILAGLKNLVGGEIRQYTQMMAEARTEAIERMTADAKALGADAVVGVRFTTTSVMQGAAELLAYGTAVRVEDEG